MQQNTNGVSMSVIKRLPRYYRYLCELEHRGVGRISSKELSEKMGFTASQIRQDFNCFGGFGQQGYGYMVPQLREKISGILGLTPQKSCILIGAGNLGRAVLSIPFEKTGFQLTGVFDSDPKLIGTDVRGHLVLPHDSLGIFCTEQHPKMAILCIPGNAVEAVAKDLYQAGVKAFWNFSHYDIALLYPDAAVETVHLNDSLMTLRYLLNE